MKYGYKIFIGILFGVFVATSLISIATIRLFERNNTIISEGFVVDMKQEQSGHFLGSYDYFVQLNNSIKWYEISETSYWIIEIGDYITIYESQRVKIKS